jgi:hypothetical protein
MPIAHKGLDGGSIVGTQASLIELQCFFLLLLRRVGHIALRRFLHSKDIAHQTSLDKDLLERKPAFLVVNAILARQSALEKQLQEEKKTE